MFKNPYSKSNVYYTKGNDELLAVIDLNTIYQDFSKFLLVLAGLFGLSYFLFESYVVVYTSILLIVLSTINIFLNSRMFYQLILKIGLRKNKYYDKVEFISHKEYLKTIVFGGQA